MFRHQEGILAGKEGGGGENKGAIFASADTNPAVVAFTPADNATAVPVQNDIVITFSEAIKAGAGAITLTNTATGTAVATTLSIVGDTLVINPNNDLAANTHYAVTIANNAITDLANNNYAGTTTYDFTTGTQGADPYAGGWHDGLGTGEVLGGVAALGLLAWLVL